jgi:hypothetical protein
MKKFLLVFSISLFSLQGFSQTINGTIDLTDPTYNRPDPGVPPTTSSTAGTAVHYDVISFIIASPGIISFTSSSGFDNFGVLYSAAGFNPASPLTNALVANDDQSGSNFGFTYNFTTPGTYYIVISPYTKSNVTGPYSVAITPATVVPVNLVSFTAEKTNGSNNVVKWSNENEVNVDKYQLQLSTDGKVFYDLANAIVTARNTSSNASYSYTIADPAEGVNFYRLRILEKSGKVTLSPVAAVNNKRVATALIKVFPNPATDYLFIQTKSNQSGKANISVINAAGAIVYTRSYVLSNQSILTVDVRTLSTGKYFIKTIINKEEKMVQFVKK